MLVAYYSSIIYYSVIMEEEDQDGDPDGRRVQSKGGYIMYLCDV